MKRPRTKAFSGNSSHGRHRRLGPTSSVSPAPTPGTSTGRATMKQVAVLRPTEAPTEATWWLTR